MMDRRTGSLWYGHESWRCRCSSPCWVAQEWALAKLNCTKDQLGHMLAVNLCVPDTSRSAIVSLQKNKPKIDSLHFPWFPPPTLMLRSIYRYLLWWSSLDCKYRWFLGARFRDLSGSRKTKRDRQMRFLDVKELQSCEWSLVLYIVSAVTLTLLAEQAAEAINQRHSVSCIAGLLNCALRSELGMKAALDLPASSGVFFFAFRGCVFCKSRCNCAICDFIR